jgi:hypothetical protein
MLGVQENVACSIGGKMKRKPTSRLRWPYITAGVLGTLLLLGGGAYGGYRIAQYLPNLEAEQLRHYAKSRDALTQCQREIAVLSQGKIAVA